MTAKSLDSQNVWGGGGAIDDTLTSSDILLKNYQNSIYIHLFTVILLSGQP